ncbi:hypothetical protein OK074_4521 [Actinobacteria bacterium OK074]|nr:hypothetical protein OK074_4521 [Actinobacteria bacterium OK074]
MSDHRPLYEISVRDDVGSSARDGMTSYSQGNPVMENSATIQSATTIPPATAIPPTVAVVGAGAAGTAVAIQLCETALRRRTPLRLVLVDPAPEAGRGVAYATRDPRHRLNVPAGNMSCYPDDPGHFVRWLCRHGEPAVGAGDFVPRHRFGAYLGDTLGGAIVRARGVVLVRRLRTRATGLGHTGRAVTLDLADGTRLRADAVVLATGTLPPATAWVPPQLAGHARLVADPWAPGALDPLLAEGSRADVLLVGSGLTAVDVALSADRDGRTVHLVSPGGRLPQPHAVTPVPALPVELLPGRSLAEVRAAVLRHIGRALRVHGDWRPGLDGLRPVTAELWVALTPAERAEFLERDGSLWNVHRHRMPPTTAETVRRLRCARRLRVHAGRVTGAADRGDGTLAVRVTPSGGGRERELVVGWVVNCTGPQGSYGGAGDPLWRSLFEGGVAVAGPLGLGVATDGGRLAGVEDGSASGTGSGQVRLPRAPLWTLGAPRRGELWETTAMPEIRGQAVAVVESVLAHLGAGPRPTPRARRLPADLSGFPLSTRAEAATAYRTGVDRLLKVRAGAQESLRRAVALDPGFGLGHAVLALAGHEFGGAVDVPRALADARRAVRERGSDHERSFVDMVAQRIQGTAGQGDRALLRHLADHPQDVLALAVAVPTIAFSGLHDIDGSAALGVVERTAAAQAGGWFHTSLLAFVRQDQDRYDEAGELALRALEFEPASGHAMHALAHVHYETGRHREGRDVLDDWLRGQGRGATHRAHFSWHAALHELALGDAEAVRARWAAQLAPVRVGGVRALVDSCSLLWRARIKGAWPGELPVGEVMATVPADALEHPATPFVALHAAVARLAARDAPGLSRLRDHALNADPVQREVIAPLCAAFIHHVAENWDGAAHGIRRVLPILRRVGGSSAQREIVEETLLHALLSASRHEEATALIAHRLDRAEPAAWR